MEEIRLCEALFPGTVRGSHIYGVWGRSFVDPSIPCSELFAHLADEELLVLDCRSIEEWDHQGSHIPGALWVAPEELAEAVSSLPDDELIVLCDGSLDNAQSQRACRLLRLCGRDAVYLQGGFLAWQRGGFPVEPHVSRRSRARRDASESASASSR